MKTHSKPGDDAPAKKEGRKVFLFVIAIFTTVSIVFLSIALYFAVTSDGPLDFLSPFIAFPWVMMTMMAIFGLAHRENPAVGSSSDWEHVGKTTWVDPHRSRAGFYVGKSRGWHGRATIDIDNPRYPAIALVSSLVLDVIQIALYALSFGTLPGLLFGLLVSYFLKHLAWLMWKDIRKERVRSE